VVNRFVRWALYLRAMGKSANLSVIDRLRNYCAYQERCHSEVKARLQKLEVPWHEHDDHIATLIAENFLNEERFARLYARSKLRQKGWGIQKIKAGLQARKVSDHCIRLAIKELEPEAYEAMLLQLARKKWDALANVPLFVRKNKTAHFLIRKGYEVEAVWKVVLNL
jgi:regulatory protein